MVCIAIAGCVHGELDELYDNIINQDRLTGKHTDLLLCCGDFQAVRNEIDLEFMAVPRKYRRMNTFYRYYSGERVAPVLTVFIGGNHEASSHLGELFHGGWVATNIYYLGAAGVVTFAGLRIAGISGIYKLYDYNRGHFERLFHCSYSVPDEQECRSVYHQRAFEVYQLLQLHGNIDIFLSHDWPVGITRYGDTNELLRKKPNFRFDIEKNTLGSPPLAQILQKLKPRYWYAAHMHVPFQAVVQHQNSNTIFTALDKCAPPQKRKYLVFMELNTNEDHPVLGFDPEWLTIIKLTNHLLSNTKEQTIPQRIPDFPSENDIIDLMNRLSGAITVRSNFLWTVPPYGVHVDLPPFQINPQTAKFCEALGIPFKFCNNQSQSQQINEKKHCNRDPRLSATAKKRKSDSIDAFSLIDDNVIPLIDDEPSDDGYATHDDNCIELV